MSWLDKVHLPTPFRFSPSAQTYRRYHGVATFFWLLAVIPTVLWLKNSILWVALMSAYANFATEFGAWQASRAEVKVDEANIANAETVTAQNVVVKDDV